jgi:hypothetical protein
MCLHIFTSAFINSFYLGGEVITPHFSRDSFRMGIGKRKIERTLTGDGSNSFCLYYISRFLFCSNKTLVSFLS